MKDLTNKKLLNIFTLVIILGIPFIQQLSFYLQSFNVINSYTSINVSMIFWFSIPILLFIYIKDIIDKKRKINIYDYIFYILVITGILVSIFSINPKVSIFGSEIRREGFVSIFTYYLLFINWKVNKTKEDTSKFLHIFIILGIINSIYAFLQIYTSFDFILRYTRDVNMATGLCGNPNFFGSFIVTILSLITSRFLMEDDIKNKDMIILVLFMISLINCQSTGPFLTYILAIIFMIIVLNIKNKLKPEKIVILVLTLVFSFMLSYSLLKIDFNIFSGNSKAISTRKEIRCELCNMKQTVDSGGNGRLDIWKNTLGVVKKYPILGVGYDNLGFAYPNKETEVYYYITNNEVVKGIIDGGPYIDNAHNVYLHILATSGILGFIPLLILLLYTLIHGLKSNEKYILILLGGFIAYSIQAFANISVIDVAPIYYIIIGLILSDVNKDKSLT